MEERLLVVTGVSSFVGYHLACHFSGNGFQVLGTITRPFHAYSSIRAERLDRVQQSGGQLAQLDITDNDAVRSFILRTKPAIWIHHAGYAENYGSLDYDLNRSFCINVAPLTQLYAALAEVDIKGVVLTGSDSEYGDNDRAHSEEDPCWPTTPYGLSKLAQTLRARQLAFRHSVNTRVARLFIPYGDLDAPQKLIPSVFDALRTHRTVDLSNCTQMRDLTFVEDVSNAYAALVSDLTREAKFDVFNVCNGEAVPLRSTLLTMADIVGADPNLLNFGGRPMREGEPRISFGTNIKIRSLLKWQPCTLQEGLRRYLETSMQGFSGFFRQGER